MGMMRKTITIPDAMDAWVKAQIDSGRYGNDSEYFRDLIRRDQDKRQAEQELLSLIQEGLDSGISTSTVHDIMKRVEDRLKRMAAYQLTNKAESEIERIYEYSILNFGLRVAQDYISGLHHCFELLASNPSWGNDYGFIKAGLLRYELFFRKHLFRANEVYLLAGDEVVVSKAGKQTYGLDRFFPAYYCGFRYVREMLKMLPEKPEPILLAQIFAKLTALGRIHPVSTGVEPS